MKSCSDYLLQQDLGEHAPGLRVQVFNSDSESELVCIYAQNSHRFPQSPFSCFSHGCLLFPCVMVSGNFGSLFDTVTHVDLMLFIPIMTNILCPP